LRSPLLLDGDGGRGANSKVTVMDGGQNCTTPMVDGGCRRTGAVVVADFET
jgi:hypothetical protein